MGVQMRNSTIVAASSLYLGVPYKVLWTLAGALIFSMIKSKKKKKKAESMPHSRFTDTPEGACRGSGPHVENRLFT